MADFIARKARGPSRALQAGDLAKGLEVDLARVTKEISACHEAPTEEGGGTETLRCDM